MADTITNIDLNRYINYNNYNFALYTVKNRSDIQYFNNKDIYCPSPFGSYIILNDVVDIVVSLLDLNKYFIETYNL